MIDVPKFYRIATKIAGAEGYDLVHSVYEKVHDKLPNDTEEANAYFYRCLVNEFYNERKRAKRIIKLPDHSEVKGLDADIVDSIINQLIQEGFGNEVNVFIESEVIGSQNDFSEISGIHRNTVKKIVTFVRSEITKRYDRINSSMPDNPVHGHCGIH